MLMVSSSRRAGSASSDAANSSLTNIVEFYESISLKCFARLASKGGFGLNIIYFRGEIREIFIKRRRASFDLDELALRIPQRRYVIM